MKANASKHKAMSYDRMIKDDARLRSEVEALLDRAEAVDAEEDVAEGAYDPAEEIRRREDRLAKMQEVREALRRETAAARAQRLREQADELRAKAADPDTSPKKQGEFTTVAAKRDEAAAQLELRSQESDHDKDDPDDDLPRNTPPSTPAGEPKPKAQRNFTDPQSRIMMRDGAFIQAYNAQLAVDEQHQIIVAAALSNQSPDAEYFQPMLNRVVDNCDAVPDRITADSGYFSASNVLATERMGALPLISVGKHQNSGTPVASSQRPQQQTPARLAMRAHLETPEGKAAYARRKATVEPVFGQIRVRGFNAMSFRGLFKNRCEWLFVAATHNLLKLWRVTFRSTATA